MNERGRVRSWLPWQVTFRLSFWEQPEVQGFCSCSSFPLPLYHWFWLSAFGLVCFLTEVLRSFFSLCSGIHCEVTVDLSFSLGPLDSLSYFLLFLLLLFPLGKAAWRRRDLFWLIVKGNSASRWGRNPGSSLPCVQSQEIAVILGLPSLWQTSPRPRVVTSHF